VRAPDGAEILGIGRITVFGIWFYHVLNTPFDLIGQLPYDMFRARGLLGVLPDPFYQALFASPGLLLGWKIALLIGCALLVLGVRPFPLFAVPVTLLLLLFDGVGKGFAAWVNHGQMGILFAAIVLCLFPAADALSVHGRKREGAARPAVYAGGVLAIAAFLSAAYAFIGTHRVVSGGSAIFTGDAILTYLAVQSLNYSAYGFQYGLLGLSSPLIGVLFKVGYAVTTLFEILSPFALVNTWFRRVWLVVIVPFHVTTLFTMNIFFWENILLIAVFVAPAGYLMRSTGDTGGEAALRRLRIFTGEARPTAGAVQG
jgi:hypothetical protein